MIKDNLFKCQFPVVSIQRPYNLQLTRYLFFSILKLNFA